MAAPAPTSDGNDDVVAMLTRQHRLVESLLKNLLETDDATAREDLLARAGDELAVHIAAEEVVIYPAVRAARTEDILLESLEEHLSLKRLLVDLMVLSPDDITFTPKCKVLEEQTRHHHEEEEEHLFPKVQRLMPPPDREALGREARAHEDRLRAEGQPRAALREQTDAAEPLVGAGDAGA